MKGLDTSVLLALLEGDPGSKDFLRRLRGEEVATTEANLLELEYLAVRGPGRHRGARKEAVARLRRKITVLPIDERAVEACSHRLGKGAEAVPPLVGAMMGALEAAGCEELLTHDPPPKMGKWKVRISRIQFHHTK
jgi:predicted nucleic acid-binding protein